MSCVQPVFHLKWKPKLPGSVSAVMPSHALDSSATVTTPAPARATAELTSRRNEAASGSLPRPSPGRWSIEATPAILSPSMWNSVHQKTALASRKARTSGLP